jgi:predicted RNase H-like HicB family nuclease
MKFIIAIEPADEGSSYGVVVPDLPGCFSAGDTLDEAISNAHEAIDLVCETMIEDGLDIPLGKTIAEHQKDPEFAGWVWAMVDVPVEKYLGPAEKINITIPRLLLSRIDEYARTHGATRSGFLAQAARQVMYG